ncbi:MAG: aminopeptidase [Thermoprotei archaeon]|nr:MAG: aminopeptidase [Thermoprotei archaeon]
MQSISVGRGFVYPDYKPVWSYKPPFNLEKVVVDIHVDLEKRSLTGRVTNILDIVRETDEIVLDAVDMEIKNVLVNGSSVNFHYDGQKLRIFFEDPLKSGERVEVVIEYSVVNPRKGVWFVPIDREDVPAIQAWTQGETEYNRYWIPTYDYLNMKASVELVIRAKKNMYVVANGDLREKTQEDEYTVWRFTFSRKISTYLVAFAVGDFSVVEERYGDVLLQYVVPRGREDSIKLSFSKTPQIMEFFEKFTGVKYPYTKYSQVCVDEYIFGGMENASLTILTSDTLHDEKAHIEFRSEPLVAHELAHQWFGDLVTCKDWSHIWLNEGFATLMQALWRREEEGEEAFIYDMVGKLDAYLSEYSRYSRPIVVKYYRYPLELFDSHSYSKGALVLWTLLNIMGEDKFRKALKLYLSRFSDNNADTEDFRKAVEEVYGEDLEWFFDQFVYSSGHPVVKYSYKWNEKEKVLELKISQEGSKDRLNNYKLDLEVEIVGQNYRKKINTIIQEETKHVTLALPAKPLAVCIDPDFKVFKELKLEVDVESLLNIFEHCEKLYPKIMAIRTLSRKATSRHVEKLAQYLFDENVFWGLRAEIAKTLSKIGGETAKRKLLEALDIVKHPKVRAQIVSVLGDFRDKKIGEALIKIIKNEEESYRTRAEAVRALAKTGHEKAFEVAKEALSYPSHNNVIQAAALEALSILGEEESRKIIEKYTDPVYPPNVRATAVRVLGRFRLDQSLMELFNHIAKSRHIKVLRSIVSAAKLSLDPRFIPLLKELQSEPEVYRAARETEEMLRKHADKGEEYRRLREEVEKLRAEERTLAERMERLEQKMFS